MEERISLDAVYSDIMKGGKRFVFDIDGVITRDGKGTDYTTALPNEPMIRIINDLYEAGNEIILFTARGYVTGIDWRETTQKQLKQWNVHYHELHFGKPNADYYVDDRMLSLNALYKMFEDKQ